MGEKGLIYYNFVSPVLDCLDDEATEKVIKKVCTDDEFNDNIEKDICSLM